MLPLLSLLSLSTASAEEGVIELGSSGTAGAAQPDVYTIQTGDTLWDISAAFMGDPYYWPKLWALNDYVTNPHWIYPGNQIILKPGTVLDAPSMELGGGGSDVFQPDEKEYVTAELECGPDVRFTADYPQESYVAPAFLAREDDVETWGHIYGAKTGRHQLGQGDLVYVELDDPDSVACGDVLTVTRRSQAVRHPEDRRVKYGNLYHVVGDVRILHIENGMATAVIQTSYSEMNRGDTVGPARNVTASLPVGDPKGDIDAVIVARDNMDMTRLAATGEVVFLDRGKADGLRVGNTFYVVHRRDEYVDIHGYDEKIPAQVVGRVVITSVEEDTATAVVVDAARQINVGDHLQTSVLPDE